MPLLLFGGTYRWSTAPLVLLAAAAALVGLPHTRPLAHGYRLLDAMLLVCLAVVALQLAPLPAPLVAALSPHAADLRRTLRLDALFAGNAGTQPLSIDTVASLHALGVFTAAALTFWVARAIFAIRGVRRVCRFLALLGAVLALASIAQRLLAPDLIAGIRRPEDVGAQPFGPFVNRNHLAAWLLMAAPVVIGYGVAHARIHLHPDAAGAARNAGGGFWTSGLLMIVVLAQTLSRSAVLGLGAALVSGWLMARRRLAWDRRRIALASGALGVAVIVLVSFVDLDRWAARISATTIAQPTDRLVIWRETMPVVHDFWLTGTGAGTYGTAMLVYQTSRVALPHLRDWAHFNQAHSHYLQLLAEGGLLLAWPVAIALLALFVAAARALRYDRGEIFWLRAGAACGLLGVAVQSIWETALRMPANAMLAAVLAALLVHDRDRR